MKKSEFKEAKQLRRQLKAEKHHLRNLEFEVETGGRRQSHVPAKSSLPAEQSDFKRMAHDAKKADLLQIEHVKSRIELLKQKFAGLGKAPEPVAPPEKMALLAAVWRREVHPIDTEVIYITLADIDKALDLNGLLKSELKVTDFIFLRSAEGHNVAEGRVVGKVGMGVSAQYQVVPVQCDVTRFFDMLNLFQRTKRPFVIV